MPAPVSTLAPKSCASCSLVVAAAEGFMSHVLAVRPMSPQTAHGHKPTFVLVCRQLVWVAVCQLCWVGFTGDLWLPYAVAKGLIIACAAGPFLQPVMIASTARSWPIMQYMVLLLATLASLWALSTPTTCICPYQSSSKQHERSTLEERCGID